MEDPIITTRAAADLLGVSIRTAQTWIEQNSIESWKTPGGHRRVRRSAVLDLMGRLREKTPHSPAIVVVHAPQHRLHLYCHALASTAECVVVADSDPYAALLSIGLLMPALVIMEVNRMDRDRLSMIRRIGQNPQLGHVQVLVIGDAARSGVVAEADLGSRLHMIDVDWSADALRARVRALVSNMGDRFTEPEPRDPELIAIAANEPQRLAAVAAAGLLDTPAEEAFDEITQLAARLLDTPIALLTLLTPDRQWFKSHWGLQQTHTPRAWAFCNYTILQKDIFIVEDATTDARFAGNPLVTGEPDIRFYAGVNVRDIDGYALGSLCVIDRTPRQLDAEQQSLLASLGRVASDRINLRIRERHLRWALNNEK
ncbi:excisionase family DNA-binding protein [Paraburkholderia bryophila]|uniref:GAF domain-containing protein n=1 Tax=Paraburkholderia bryophila TaxID=420952 RepID=UPI00234AA566|nr:GAF domain-containing protein [Paraburkholderia bryophila]WCM18760.1 excisionase family DNA-binding protein [Paraburkholderia bryophila]